VEIAKGLFETLKKVTNLFNEAGLPYCLIGGLAVGMLAKPRATEDIDLLVFIDEKNEEIIRNLFGKNFEIIQDQGLTNFKEARIWRIVIKDAYSSENGFVIIDMILADNRIYREAVTDVVKIKIDETIISVVTPENLIRIKSISNRPVDLLDIEAIKESLSTI
jgi:Nucleotidyl transferase of unknown function (DUF2204)